MNSTTNNTKQLSIRDVATTPFVKHSMQVIQKKTMAKRKQRGDNRYTNYHAFQQSGANKKDWSQFKSITK